MTEAVREHPAPPSTLGVDAAETAQAAHPNSAPDALALGFSYYKVEAWEQAIPALENAAKLAPAEATPFLYLGYAQMAAGALSSAEGTLARAAALPGISPRDKSEALLQRGNCLYAEGNNKAAHDAFAQSLAANSNQGMAALALGTLEAQDGHAAQAEIFFLRAAHDLPAAPRRAQAFACLGLLSEAGKKNSEAAARYQKALDLDKQNVPAQKGLARTAANKAAVKKH